MRTRIFVLVGVCAGLGSSGCSSSNDSARSNGPAGSPAFDYGSGDNGGGNVGAPSGVGGANNGAPYSRNTAMGGAANPSPTLGAGGASSPAGADAGAAPPPTVPVVVNPFTLTAHDPLSTFGADVDTASYDQFVRDIGNGRLPDPSTVRTEDFVNFFSYDYPGPASDSTTPFAISLAAAPSLFHDGTTILRVGIQGKKPSAEKKPANIVFLVDHSGSMGTPEKLPLVQRVMHHSLEVLSPTDTVSIVEYASSTEVVLPPTPVSSAYVIDSAIDDITTEGSTNGASGIQLAYDAARASFIQGGINDVILCTDGDFNVGISDTGELVNFITTERKSGITLTALGFGSSVNDPMMEAVSNAGNGVYAVVGSESQADQFVSERLLSDITYIAQDVKIQVEFNPDQVVAYRLVGYEDRAIPDAQFRNDVVDAGEIGAGHRVTALYQVVLTGGTVPNVVGAAPLNSGAPFAGTRQVASTDAVLVKVRYKNVGATETDPALEVATPMAASAIGGDIANAEADFRWAVAVGATAEILRGSPYASKAALPDIQALVAGAAGTDARRTEFSGLLTKAVGLF